MRWHFLLVAFLLVFEMRVGLAVVGASVGFITAMVALIRAIKWKHQRSHLLRVAGVYALLFVGTTAAIELNSLLAFRRAEPVITAVERYHADHGRYPERMEELVPTYLSSIPKAGFTYVSRQFWYEAKRPQVYFAAMFHGVYFYDFPTRRWLANE